MLIPHFSRVLSVGEARQPCIRTVSLRALPSGTIKLGLTSEYLKEDGCAFMGSGLAAGVIAAT